MSTHEFHVQEKEKTFICVNCGRKVEIKAFGTANRNHCPSCLHSVHADLNPGDRRSTCKGVMKPIGVSVSSNGEWSLIHRCEKCGFIRANRIAGDDNEAVLVSIALKPISRLPFPLESIIDSAVSTSGQSR